VNQAWESEWVVGGDRGTYSAAVVAGQAQGVRGIGRAQSELTCQYRQP
jgi:hypothetical protein